MKKILVSLMFLVCVNTVSAYEYKQPVTNDIKDSQTIGYTKETKVWSKNPVINEDTIVFTKFMTKGSGGYSEYEADQKQFEVGNGSTYEFIDGTNLIGYNAHTLKFFKLDFNGEKIVSTELTPQEVHKYFPDVEIVKVSQFKNNKIELKKPWFQKKTFMLLNDTKTDFYKYQFENDKNYQIIRGIFEAQKTGTIVFSHFASKDNMFPPMYITIKNGK